MIHHRFIFPVGHGGFAFEKLENISVIFDCGSDNCSDRVFQYIDAIKDNGITQIDYLFISHFDNDHVDCISKLLNTLSVKEAVIPHIPNDYRIVYNLYTNNAYSRIIGILRNKEIMVREISEDITVHKEHNIWEWIAHNQIDAGDWTNLNNEMANKGIATKSLNNAHYVDNHKEVINACFKKVFGSKGPNVKGLMMLSQKTVDANINFSRVYTCRRVDMHHFHHHINHIHFIFEEIPEENIFDNSKYTGALYTGDADLKGRKPTNLAKNFYDSYKREDKLVLCQIPHHGSKYNSAASLTSVFPALYYFYHDNSDARIRNNLPLFNTLLKQKQLLGLHNVDSDIVCGITDVY